MRLTAPLNLPAPGRRQAVYFILIDFAQPCVFGKQSLPLLLCNSLQLSRVNASPTQEHTFSRSYGINLPSSLTRVLSRALVCSTTPPVSVSGTGGYATHKRCFSWKRGLNPLIQIAQRAISASPLDIIRAFVGRTLLRGLPTGLHRHFHSSADLTFSVPSLAQTLQSRCRNIHLLAIDYDFRPRLRTRLTQGGRTCPWNP